MSMWWDESSGRFRTTWIYKIFYVWTWPITRRILFWMPREVAHHFAMNSLGVIAALDWIWQFFLLCLITPLMLAIRLLCLTPWFTFTIPEDDPLFADSDRIPVIDTKPDESQPAEIVNQPVNPTIEEPQEAATMAKKIICIDFDGVIHSYDNGFGDGSIYGSIVPGFFEWVLKVRETFDLAVYSSRSKTLGGLGAMMDWMNTQLKEWKKNNNREPAAPPFLSDFVFAVEKPAAFLTIDDRAVCFDGNWFDERYDPSQLLNFKPWNKK